MPELIRDRFQILTHHGGCSVMIAEVSVDMETGEVTDAHDCGLSINRTQVEGQMEGSVAILVIGGHHTYLIFFLDK